MSSIFQRMKALELWALQNHYRDQGDQESVLLVGKELMERTDTSPLRCAESNRECAERRQAMQHTPQVAL